MPGNPDFLSYLSAHAKGGDINLDVTLARGKTEILAYLRSNRGAISHDVPRYFLRHLSSLLRLRHSSEGFISRYSIAIRQGSSSTSIEELIVNAQSEE